MVELSENHPSLKNYLAELLLDSAENQLCEICQTHPKFINNASHTTLQGIPSWTRNSRTGSQKKVDGFVGQHVAANVPVASFELF